MAEEEIIQADETADDETLNVIEDESSPSDELESEQTSETEEEDSATDGEEEYEPFKHTVKYKAAGEEREFNLTYTEEGDLTPETREQLTQVLAKTGLERVAQEKDEAWKREQRAREAAEARNKYLESQVKMIQEQYQKPIDYLRQTPNMERVLQQKGIALPDPAKIQLELDREQVDARKRAIDQQQFKVELAQKLTEKYPHFGVDELNAIGAALDSTPSLKHVFSNPKQQLLDYLPDVLHETDLVIAKMIVDGKLPNPALEKARRESENASKQIAKTKERAKKRMAVRSPVAGGKARGSRGADKTVDMTGWSPQEAALYYATKKLPPGR